MGERSRTEDDEVLAETERPPTDQQTGNLILTFENGGPSAVRPFSLAEADGVTFGRAEGSRVARIDTLGGQRRLFIELEDHLKRTSVLHAHMRRCAAGWTLEDARSRNGTWHNGSKVSSAVLRDGDLIELGRSFLVFRECAHLPAIDPDLPMGMLTWNAPLGAQFERLAAISRATIPVLIRGPTGSGKELVARAVHELSNRSGPFLAVNCGALPRSLLESELFGYRKGSFSGASNDRLGLVRSAHQGTLFLDEIGDLPLDAQATLLRVIQEREVLPIGSVKPVPVDVRLIAATHRDLDFMVNQEHFRADLLARINGFGVRLPPLRDRLEDLGLLIRNLRHRGSADSLLDFSAATVRLFYEHAWSGNIRELEKVIETAIILAAGKTIELSHLPEIHRTQPPPPRHAIEPTPGDGQRERLEAMLTRYKGNVTSIASEMRTSRMQVHRLCRRFGLDIRDYRPRS